MSKLCQFCNLFFSAAYETNIFFCLNIYVKPHCFEILSKFFWNSDLRSWQVAKKAICALSFILLHFIIIFHSQDLLSRDVLLMFPSLRRYHHNLRFATWVSLGMSRRCLTIFDWIEIDFHLGAITQWKSSRFGPQCKLVPMELIWWHWVVLSIEFVVPSILPLW